MKIPTYQQHISYQYTPARSGKVAAPVATAYTSKWDDIATFANLVSAGQMSIKKLQEQRNGSNAPAPANPAQPTNPAQPAPAPNGPAAPQTAHTSSFSDKSRADLLAFSRQKMAQNTDSAVSELDHYVQSHLSANPAQLPGQAAQSLFAQDYVIIRREMQDIAAKQQQEQQAEHFEQGARHFLQTAALISTPNALEEYMQANLRAADEETAARPETAGAWPEQKKQLYVQAVSHNIEAALQAGQLPQAQNIYSHFAAHLPTQQSQLLQEKITTVQVQQLAQAAWPSVRQNCFTAQAYLDPEKLHTWVEKNCEDASLKKPVEQALQGLWQQQQQQRYHAQADFYNQCLQNPAAADGLVTPGWEQDASQWQKTQQLVRAYQQEKNFAGDAAVFNSLYEKTLNGRLSEAEIEQAFEEKRLSAGDTLRLKYAFCAKQTGQTDGRETLLNSCVEQLAGRYGLSETQLQQAKYYVYSAGTNFADKLHAAQQLKQMFTLQENIK